MVMVMDWGEAVSSDWEIGWNRANWLSRLQDEQVSALHASYPKN
jgi:hypothetical protein